MNPILRQRIAEIDAAHDKRDAALGALMEANDDEWTPETLREFDELSDISTGLMLLNQIADAWDALGELDVVDDVDEQEGVLDSVVLDIADVHRQLHQLAVGGFSTEDHELASSELEALERAVEAERRTLARIDRALEAERQERQEHELSDVDLPRLGRAGGSDALAVLAAIVGSIVMLATLAALAGC